MRQFTISSRPTGQWLYLVLFAVLTVAIAGVHLWQLDAIPRGLYVDESSIGLNAATIAEGWRDEHGHWLPVFFEAFGEYKNPVYIYTAALLFGIFGISVWVLKFTSVLYLAVFLIGLAALCRRLYPGNTIALCFAWLAGGTLPWIFAISRVSFELIAQPAVWVWLLYALFRAYQEQPKQRWWLWPAVSGLLAGLAVYTYSTSRLLVFALLVSVVIVYYHRSYWLRHLVLALTFAITLIPYLIFAWQHPGALTERFNLISYLNDPGLTALDKADTFITYYLSYWSADFLLLSGDANLRHHAGPNGMVFISVVIMAVVGLVWMLRRNEAWGRFSWLLVIGLLISPIAAAMTEPSHGLRSLLVAVYIVILAAGGVAVITNWPQIGLRRTVLALVIALLIMESTSYLYHYFRYFPEQSEAAFESYGFPAVLQLAVDQQPHQIIVSNRANQPYAHLEFYRRIINIPDTIDTSVTDPIASPDSCIIYFAADQTIFDDHSLPASFVSDERYAKLQCY